MHACKRLPSSCAFPIHTYTELHARKTLNHSKFYTSANVLNKLTVIHTLNENMYLD